MVWQDIVIAVCTIFFGYALIPQVYQGFKLKRGAMTVQTSLITTSGLYIICITFLTLEMYFSATMNFITGTLWLILLAQRIIYPNQLTSNN